MVSPSLHSLLAKARVEELHRGAQNSLYSEVNRPPTVRLSTLITRAINPLFAGGRAMNDETRQSTAQPRTPSPRGGRAPAPWQHAG